MTEPTEVKTNVVEGKPFISLKNILEDEDFSHITLAELVTAIEALGIYTKDRFGIFKNYTYLSIQGERAFDLLSFYMDYEQKKASGVRGLFGESLMSPLVGSTGRSKPSDYANYGWPEDKLPNFSAIGSKKINEKPFSERERKSYLRTIGALLKFIKGEMKGVKPHTGYTSNEDLIAIIEAEFNDKKIGLSKRSLEGKFKEAIDELS